MPNGPQNMRSQFLTIVATPVVGCMATMLWTVVGLRGADSLTGEQRLMLGIGMAFVVAATAVATLVVFRSMRRRVITLNAAATQSALIELPRAIAAIAADPDAYTDPPEIALAGADELSDLGAAIDAIQNAALQATRDRSTTWNTQTELLLALGRRNQSLVGDQLDLITILERDETDSTTLQNLFQLDHLATRMRRNTESLVALSGTTNERAWPTPVAVGDVLRAALSEIADYRRVNLDVIGRAWIAGAIAPDLTHLIAELLDNALTFCPNRTIDVRCRDASEGFVVQVIDYGPGVDPLVLRDIERRMRDSHDGPLAPELRGLYLVGHLAERHGLEIVLSETDPSGVTATVFLPVSVLASTIERPPNASARSAAMPVPDALTVLLDPGHDSSGAPASRAPATPALPAPATTGAERTYTLANAPAIAQLPAPQLELDLTTIPPMPMTTLPVAPSPALAAATATHTRSGLVVRRRAPSLPNPGDAPDPAATPTPAVSRDPEVVRDRLSRFRSGIDRGRANAHAATNAPAAETENKEPS